jgi:ribosome-binding factor A
MVKRYNRKQRVNDLIQTELAAIVQQESGELGIGMVTITSVEVAPDLSHARVFVSVLDDSKSKETVSILNNATKSLRYALAQAVKLRITPDLKFVYDDSILRGNRISSLINDALKSFPSDEHEK